MAKFICSICGYVHEDITAPDYCPACMAPASEFSETSETKKESPTENDPMGNIFNNKVVEAIETEGGNTDQLKKTGDSHPKENTKNTIESSEATNPTNDINDIHIINNENAVSTNVELDADEEAILRKHQEIVAAKVGADDAWSVLVKWYKKTYNVDIEEAMDRVDFVLDKHGLQSLSRSGNGCMVTIMIAISTTLSTYFLL